MATRANLTHYEALQFAMLFAWHNSLQESMINLLETSMTSFDKVWRRVVPRRYG